MPSGSIPTNVVNGCAVRIYWSLVSQSVENNTSTVSWQTLGDGTGTVGATTSHINGVQVGYSAGGAIAPGTLLSNGSYTVAHEPDGTGTIGCAVVSSTAGCTLYGGTAWALPTIPRYATLTDAPDFCDSDNPVIRYQNPLGENVGSLQACISLTGQRDDIPYRDVPKTGSSYRFNLTAAERNTLRNATPGTSRTVIFYLKTVYNGHTEYATLTKTFTLNAAGAKPTAGCTVTVHNTDLPAAFDGVAVQGKSRLAVTVTGSAKYGATVVSAQTLIAGISYTGFSFTSDVLTAPGSTAVYPTVTDSRGLVSDAQAAATVTVLPYESPKILPATGSGQVCCYRANAAGEPKTDSTTLWVRAKKSCSPVNGLNKCLLRLRTKTAAAQSWGPWQTLLGLSAAAEEYAAAVPGSYAADTVYDAELSVTDTLGSETTVRFKIPTDTVTLHLGEGGRAVGIGRYADTALPDSLKIAFKTYCEAGAEVTGNVSVTGGVTAGGDISTGGKLTVSGAACADSLNLAGSPVADFILESGELEDAAHNANWFYTKRKSGKVEVFGAVQYEGVALNTAWQSVYSSGLLTAVFPQGLFSEGCYPICHIDTFYDSGYITAIVKSGAADSTGVSFWLTGPESKSNLYAVLSFRLIGY